MFGNALEGLDSGLPGTEIGLRDRGIIQEAIAPGMSQGAIDLAAAPVEISNMLAAGVDTAINVVKWAGKSLEKGEVAPYQDKRYISSANPLLGSTDLTERVAEVAEETTPALRRLAVDLNDLASVETPFEGAWGLLPRRIGLGTFMAPGMVDVTPKTGTKLREAAALIARISGGAVFEGAAMGALLRRLTDFTDSPTLERIRDVITEFQTTNPKAALALEGLMGGVAGTSMVVGMEGLKRYWPEAPEPIKQLVTAGFALTGPSVANVAARGAIKAGGIVPGVGLILKAGRKARLEFLKIVHPEYAERAAGQQLLSMGSDWRSRSGVLGVADQLSIAMMRGRQLDDTTKVVYTLPQMARNEANILEARIFSQAESMSLDQLQKAWEKVADLRKFAAYQESSLATILKDPEVGPDLYVKFANRLLDNRDKLFSVINKSVLKMNLGGRSSEGADPRDIATDYAVGEGTGRYEYAENRRRAVHEGRGGAISGDVIKDYKKAFSEVGPVYEEVVADILKMAEEQIALWRKHAPEDVDPESLNRQIARIINEAYLKADMFEDTVWRAITGTGARRTEPYISPSGEDLGPQILIEGLPIGEFYANKVARLEPGEDTWQSKYLWKLSGRNNIVESLKKIDPVRYGKMANKLEQSQVRENVAREREGDLELRMEAAQKKLVEAQQADVPQTKEIVKLEGALEKVTGLWRTASGDASLAAAARKRAQDDLNLFGDSNPNFLGDEVDLQTQVNADGELGLSWKETETEAGYSGVHQGQNAQAVENIITILKRELRAEGDRGAKKEPRKIAAISQMVEELQNAIATNFPVDMDLLNTARIVSGIKKDAFGKDSPVAKLLQTAHGGAPKVEPEAVSASLLGRGTAGREMDRGLQATHLRELQLALQPFDVGPERLFVLDPEADHGIGINPKVTWFEPESGRDPKLLEPTPFVEMTQGGRRTGFQVKEGTPPTADNIRLVQGLLWSRFKKFSRPGGEPFDDRAATKWIDDNKDAINWLEQVTGEKTGFEDLTRAETTARQLRSIDGENLDKTVAALRKRGVFADADADASPWNPPSGQYTEKAFRDLIDSARSRDSNLESARVILGDIDLNKVGKRLWDNIMESDVSVDSMLNDILQVLKNGELENGSNPALDGFKNVISEHLFKKILSDRTDSTDAGAIAKRIADERQTDITLIDPDKLKLLLDNPRTMELLSKLYGEHAPALMRKISDGTYQAQTFVSEAHVPGASVKNRGIEEFAGNLGRILGLQIAKTGLVNSLVATGMGRRAATVVVRNLQGKAIERLVGEALIDSEFAMILMKKAGALSDPEKATLWKRIEREFNRSILKPLTRKIEDTPGAVYSVLSKPYYPVIPGPPEEKERPDTADPGGSSAPLGLQRPSYQGVDEGYSPGPQTSLQPPARRMAANASQSNRPSPASALSQVNPVGPPTGPSSQEMVQRGRDVFGPNDPIFAAHGGYLAKESGIMSVPCKPRQLVG
tara:strand:+ start:4304 stop:8746 length:4443 start_codon:yes stop_codon:yes gene_type:complete